MDELLTPPVHRRGVPPAWLVDLTTRQLEVHREPRADRYGSVLVLTRGERVSSMAFPDLSLDVAELIG
jgi:Uma2 family endonuclease